VLFGAGFDEAAEHFGDLDAAFLDGGGRLDSILIEVENLHFLTAKAQGSQKAHARPSLLSSSPCGGCGK